MDLCTKFYNMHSLPTDLEVINFWCRLHSRWMISSHFSFTHLLASSHWKYTYIHIFYSLPLQRFTWQLISTPLRAPLVMSIWNFRMLYGRNDHMAVSIINYRITTSLIFISTCR